MPTVELLKALYTLSSSELEDMIEQRRCEEKALRALWRATVQREREEAKQKRAKPQPRRSH